MPDTVIPVYPTWAQFWRLPRPRRNASWRRWFPFNAGGNGTTGSWAFSGRVALHHGLPSLRLPPGSTILVPAYHQGVEIDTLLAAGYRLRYYRITQQLEIDFADLERRLDATVAALYVIHYFGFAQPLDRVRAFCAAHRLPLIEDCALSLFSKWRDTWLGSVGDLALFSVYKTLPLPHGGFLVAKHGRERGAALRPAPLSSTLVQTFDLIHNALQASRWRAVERGLIRASRWARRTLHWDREQTISSGGAGWDPRLLTHDASASSVWLMRFMNPEEVIARRRRNFVHLASRLRDHLPLPLADLPPGVCPLFMPVMVGDKVRFQREMAALGVHSVNLWDASHPTCPPDLADEFAGWRRHCLELPIHQELSPQDVDRVADAALAVLQLTAERPALARLSVG